MDTVQSQQHARRRSFGKTPSDETVDLIALRYGLGFAVTLISLGESIHRIHTLDQFGEIGDVALYCERLEDYLNQKAFLGTSTGRFANRIAEYRKYKRGFHPFSSPVPGKECAGATGRAG